MVARVALLILIVCSPAFAWSLEGHQIVCWIAENRLTAEAQAAVHELLDGAHISDAEVCGWADEIRRQRRDTEGYHYINSPFDSDGYDAARDDPKGVHVVKATPSVPHQRFFRSAGDFRPSHCGSIRSECQVFCLNAAAPPHTPPPSVNPA
ncbi:MAG: hypothetical protein H7144_12390 [Burkholderiales bacterium]|nr:hypothetical protein [Phycisphaerae bacterium]